MYGFFKRGKEENAYNTQAIISVYQANEGTTEMVFMGIRKLPRGPRLCALHSNANANCAGQTVKPLCSMSGFLMKWQVTLG